MCIPKRLKAFRMQVNVTLFGFIRRKDDIDVLSDVRNYAKCSPVSIKQKIVSCRIQIYHSPCCLSRFHVRFQKYRLLRLPGAVLFKLTTNKQKTGDNWRGTDKQSDDKWLCQPQTVFLNRTALWQSFRLRDYRDYIRILPSNWTQDCFLSDKSCYIIQRSYRNGHSDLFYYFAQLNIQSYAIEADADSDTKATNKIL